jgi:SnoaL-like polyketide cyclase.
MDVRELIERYNAAWNAHDVDAIHELHDPDIVFHNHTADERAEGADAVREHIAEIFRNNPTLQFTTRSLRGRRLRRLRMDCVDRLEGVGRRRRLPAQEREDRPEGRLLGVASGARTLSWRTSGRL